MFETSHIDRDAILDAMRQGVDYHFKIKCRGFDMVVRPLTIMEEEQIVASVAEYMGSLPAHARNSITENVALAKEYLKKASTSDVGIEDPKIHDEQLKRMTADEIQYLFKQYVGVKEKVNPALERMNGQELQSLVEVLKKSPEGELDSALIGLSFLEMVNVCRSLLLAG